MLNIQRAHIDKAKYWGKQISITGAAQIIVQAVGFLSGILVIRLLSVEQYAYYTIANAMLGTMTVLSDGGISSGVMAQGRKVWQDREKLGAVLNTGLYLRKRFACGALAVSIPILCYLLWKQGADWVTCILITASLIPAFFAALSDNLLQIIPKLHQLITPLQKNQVSVGVRRLILSGLTLFAFPWAFIAILASGFPRVWGNRKLRKIVDPYIAKNQEINPDDQSEIMKVCKRTLPNSIYISLSGQITIWLLSFFGNINSVAEIGALSRITILLSIFSSVVSMVMAPKFAILKDNKLKVLKSYWQIQGFCVLSLCVAILGIYFFSDIILRILGTDYLDLKEELMLNFTGGSIALMGGISFVLCAARGWIISPYIAISSNFLSIIICCLLFDVSEINGVLWMSIMISVILLIQNNIFAWIKINKLTKE